MRHCADLNHGLNGPRLEAAQRKAMQHTCSTSLPPLQKRRVCGAAANSDRRVHPGLVRMQRGPKANQYSWSSTEKHVNLNFCGKLRDDYRSIGLRKPVPMMPWSEFSANPFAIRIFAVYITLLSRTPPH